MAYRSAVSKSSDAVTGQEKHAQQKDARHHQDRPATAHDEDENERAETNQGKADLGPAAKSTAPGRLPHVGHEALVIGGVVPTRSRAAPGAVRSYWLIGSHALGAESRIGELSLWRLVRSPARRTDCVG